MKKAIHKDNRTYPIGYDLHVVHEPKTAKELALKGLGNADAIFFATCFKDKDGRLVPYPYTVKEGKKPLDPTEMYDVLIGIAGQLLNINREAGTLLSRSTINCLNILVKNDLETHETKRKNTEDNRGHQPDSGPSESPGDDNGSGKSTDLVRSGEGNS